MPLINASINFEEAVKNIVARSFPAAQPDADIRDVIDGGFAGAPESASLKSLATGVNKFVMGNRWGSSRVVGP